LKTKFFTLGTELGKSLIQLRFSTHDKGGECRNKFFEGRPKFVKDEQSAPQQVTRYESHHALWQATLHRQGLLTHLYFRAYSNVQ
ncbi:hypothetical protein P3W50_14355, partial [Pseudomonas putida]